MADPLIGYNLAAQGTSFTSSTLPNSQPTAAPTSTPGRASSGIPIFKYPLKMIDAGTDYLEIKIVEYIPSGKGENNILTGEATLKINNASDVISKSTLSPLAYILLPIPQNVTEGQTLGWGESSIDPYSAFLYGNAIKFMDIQKPNDIPDQLKQAYQTAANTFLTGNGVSLAKSALAGAAVQNLGANVDAAGVLARTTGQVINPNMELLFTGPSIRTFPFSFEFSPRDPKESEIVKQIIRTLKKHMTTKKDITNGLFIKTPDIFQLTYKTGSKPHPFLNKFKPAALIELNVNYTGSGVYSTYNDATPVHIIMSLTFKELNPIYDTDYDDSNTNVGY